MIFTSCYDVCNLQNDRYNFCSISGDHGKKVNFNGNYCCELAPKKAFWEIWHKNIGKITDEDNNRFYVEQYWEQVLSLLDANEIYKKFDDFETHTILLCYEKHNDFCHRHIVSAWLELATKEMVPEIEQDEAGQLIIVERPTWIKEYLQQVVETF